MDPRSRCPRPGPSTPRFAVLPRYLAIPTISGGSGGTSTRPLSTTSHYPGGLSTFLPLDLSVYIPPMIVWSLVIALFGIGVAIRPPPTAQVTSNDVVPTMDIFAKRAADAAAQRATSAGGKPATASIASPSPPSITGPPTSTTAGTPSVAADSAPMDIFAKRAADAAAQRAHYRPPPRLPVSAASQQAAARAAIRRAELQVYRDPKARLVHSRARGPVGLALKEARVESLVSDHYMTGMSGVRHQKILQKAAEAARSTSEQVGLRAVVPIEQRSYYKEVRAAVAAFEQPFRQFILRRAANLLVVHSADFILEVLVSASYAALLGDPMPPPEITDGLVPYFILGADGWHPGVWCRLGAGHEARSRTAFQLSVGLGFAPSAQFPLGSWRQSYWTRMVLSCVIGRPESLAMLWRMVLESRVLTAILLRKARFFLLIDGGLRLKLLPSGDDCPYCGLPSSRFKLLAETRKARIKAANRHRYAESLPAAFELYHVVNEFLHSLAIAFVSCIRALRDCPLVRKFVEKHIKISIPWTEGNDVDIVPSAAIHDLTNIFSADLYRKFRTILPAAAHAAFDALCELRRNLSADERGVRDALDRLHVGMQTIGAEWSRALHIIAHTAEQITILGVGSISAFVGQALEGMNQRLNDSLRWVRGLMPKAMAFENAAVAAIAAGYVSPAARNARRRPIGQYLAPGVDLSKLSPEELAAMELSTACIRGSKAEAGLEITYSGAGPGAISPDMTSITAADVVACKCKWHASA